MKQVEGFLIVLREIENPRGRNKRYRGVDRVPNYRLQDQEPIKQEIAAMDDYILGSKRNDTGVIEGYEEALDLYRKFGNSPRQFEVLRCRGVGKRVETQNSFSSEEKHLGFDVAVIDGDYWSIVGDFPNDPRVDGFLSKLNEYGLFGTSSEAENFLHCYRTMRLPDHEMSFEVIEVWLASPS